MRDALQEKLQLALRALLDDAGDSDAVPDFALDLPKRKDHGDFACNAAMMLAKRLKKSPRDIAESLVEQLGNAGGLVERCEIAGPGFVNVWLSPQRWQALLHRILSEGGRYGHNDTGKGVRVQVEFVSANPTGPLTLGHGRQAVLGDTISRLLRASGYDVTREYYFNNGGRQMRVLGQSVQARYLESLGRAAAPPASAFAEGAEWPDEIDGLPVRFPKDGYQGAYIADLAAGMREDHGDALADAEDESAFRKVAEENIFAEIRGTLERVGIGFDVYYNETTLYEEGKLEEVIADLRAKGLVYDAEDAVWLRATELGLDRDRVIVKRTGEPTYLLPDIAYHREKFRRGFDTVIDVQGADHIEQFPFVREAAGALDCPKDRIELVMHQFVTLSSGGEQVKQSTRKANYVTVDELVEDVGTDVFRFFMVQRRAEGHLDFDLDLAKSKEWKKNPAFAVQYAHARSCGVQRKAGEESLALPGAERAQAVASALVLPEEIDLLRKLSEFPDIVAEAGRTREPHHVAYYARELAGLWNPYLQDGKHHRVLSEDGDLTQARLALAAAVRTTLANALELLGLSAPERM